MKSRLLSVALFLVLMVSLTGNARATNLPGSSKPSLVYVELSGSADLESFASMQLPMVTMLGNGLLATADLEGQKAMEKAGLQFQVIDPNLQQGVYYQTQTFSDRTTPDYSAYGQVLLDLGSSVVLRMDPAQVDALTQAGVEVRAISLAPKPLPTSQADHGIPQSIEPDPLIQLMIDQVTQEKVYEYDRGLAGEIPVWVDNAWYTITSRRTGSGQSIQKATSYFGQHLTSLGMDVEYHTWDNSTNPNVIGEIRGLVNPDDIYIIGGHIDDVQSQPGGADDNASGTVAAMIAADIFSQYQWGCTLRFAAWTGEEQGLLGSAAYAQRAYQQGENILGYLNLDMIAWNTPNSSPSITLSYKSNDPETYDLALLFAEVVGDYNINLVPTFDTDSSGSDHASFWDYGYNAILGIEDISDFNPYYHGSYDISANTDPAFFTNFVKASVGTLAHMSECLIPNGVGYLDGHVTDAANGMPIIGATVTASDDLGHSYPATTDITGYYTRTLLSNTYAVTAEAYGYDSLTVNDVSVTTDTVTTQDFALAALPTYTVSGYVKDSVSGEPLEATVEFTDAPIAPVTTDPATGFYSISVAEGTWNLQASASLHTSQIHQLVVDHDLMVDYLLDPLPCILLVDDDGNNPDVMSYYTSALDNLGYDYAVWNVSTDGDPASSSLLGYRHIVWFTGYPYSNTFNDSNEAAVGTYLEAGGNFFLSGQDYLYDMGLTNFARNYLHIASYTSDVNQTTVTGQNVFSGLGPYGLSYPFTNYSDIVNPDAQGKVSFNGNQGNAAVSYDGTSFNTVFFGYPFEAISSLTNRSAVMQRAVEFFGGCEPPVRVTIAPASQEHTGQPGTQVSFDYTVTNDSQVAQDVNLSVGSLWPVEAPSSTGVLQPGASAEVSVAVSIPSQPDVIIGQDTFTLTAEGVEGGVAEATGTTYANVTPGVEVSGPAGQSGQPLGVLTYEFEVTNTGDYTDTFSLGLEGAWQVSLPGGTSTGPLAPGASTTVTVLVTVPGDVADGDTNVTILTATSGLDPLVTGSAQVTSTAIVLRYISLLPIITR